MTTEPLPSNISELGPWLAHYSTSEAVFEHILPCRRLRMSPYRKMRDPLENKDLRFGIAWYGDPAGIEDALQQFTDHVNEVRKGMRVLSLTGDAMHYQYQTTFACCWARPRMWEQYGDKHRGAALVFRREALKAAFEADLSTKACFTLVR